MGIDGVVYLDIKINRIRNPSTDADVSASGGIGAFDFTLTYPGGTTGNAVNIMAVKEVSPFTTPVSNVQNASGSALINAYQTGATHQAPLTLVKVAPRILGSNAVTHNIVLSVTILANGLGDNMPADSSKTFSVRRGDARKDGSITITDALFVAQYLAGLRGIGETTSEVQAINAASVKLESATTGEKVTIVDALFIAQFLAGLRDASFN